MDERKKVLVVEDETLTAMALEAHLVDLGCRVVGLSATGEDAVLKAKTEEPDLVFMDVRLAGAMDGLEAARLINLYRPTPVVIISGFAEVRTEVIKPVAYLSKPLNFDDIGTIIGSLV